MEVCTDEIFIHQRVASTSFVDSGVSAGGANSRSVVGSSVVSGAGSGEGGGSGDGSGTGSGAGAGVTTSTVRET